MTPCNSHMGHIHGLRHMRGLNYQLCWTLTDVFLDNFCSAGQAITSTTPPSIHSVLPTTAIIGFARAPAYTDNELVIRNLLLNCCS